MMRGGLALYQIDNFKEMNKLEKIAIKKHAKVRLEELGIRVDDVTHCIEAGEIIKQYEDDKPDSTQWESDVKTRSDKYVMYGM